MKTTLLNTMALALLALGANAQTVLYSNDFTTSPNSMITGSGAFTHNSDGNNWTIKAAGTGEWDMFEMALPSTLNLSGPHPTVKLTGVSSDSTAMLTVMLIDVNGHSADYYIEHPDPGFFFEIKGNVAAKDYSYDYQGQFHDIHGSLVDGSGQGVTDSTQITKLRFRVNPGWASAPHTSTITGIKYNFPLNGTIKIDKLEIMGSSLSGIPTILTLQNVTLSPNPTTGPLNISVADKSGEAMNVTVSNMLGQVVYNTKANFGDLHLDLSGVEKGMYLVRLESKQGVKTTRIIIK